MLVTVHVNTSVPVLIFGLRRGHLLSSQKWLFRGPGGTGAASGLRLERKASYALIWANVRTQLFWTRLVQLPAEGQDARLAQLAASDNPLPRRRGAT